MSGDLFPEAPRTPIKVTMRDQAASIAREVKMREAAYPKWVRDGRMTQQAADLELARMRAVLQTLNEILAPNPALLEAIAREADREDSAMRGEPSPWRDEADDPALEATFRSERRAVMRTALDAFREWIDAR